MRKIISLIIISMLISCSEEIEKISSEDLAKKLTIVDMHIDTPYRLWRQNLNGDEIDDISKRTLKGDFDYPRAVSGGLNVPFFSMYVLLGVLTTDARDAGLSIVLITISIRVLIEDATSAQDAV